MRKSTASKRRDKNNGIKAILIVIMILIIGACILWWFVDGRDKLAHRISQVTLCPIGKDGHEKPNGHVVLLVDKTDVLGFTQNKAFLELLNEFVVGKRVPEGTLLSVFVLGQDYKDTPEPIFQKCNPGDGSHLNTLFASPDSIKKSFSEKYQAALQLLPEQMTATTASDYSPIFEMLQMVSLNLKKNDVDGPRELYIVSDMLQNTKDISFFNMNAINYDLFKKSPIFSSLSSDMKNVDVNIYYLLLRPDLQTLRLNNFWEFYFKDMGGRLNKVDKIMGSRKSE